MLNQFAVEIPTLPVDQCHSHPHPKPEGMLRYSFVTPCRREGAAKHCGTHMVFRETFLQIQMRHHEHLILKNCINGVHRSRNRSIQWRKVKDKNKTKKLRCQSGPPAENSVIFSGGDSSKNYGADQQQLQISDPHFDKFSTSATFACRKIRFKTEVCTCSQFPTEAMLWIKVVEMVDSVDNLKSSSSTRGIPMPNSEVLDARIASALNKIIHSSHFKRRLSLEEQKDQKEEPFPSWRRQMAYLIYEYFRVTGANDSVENYADLFPIVLRNDDIQEFDSKWDGISLSMTKIPPDDILERIVQIKNTRV